VVRYSSSNKQAEHRTAFRPKTAAALVVRSHGSTRDSTRRPAKEAFLAFLSSRAHAPLLVVFYSEAMGEASCR
jgi:hypothetical protein